MFTTVTTDGSTPEIDIETYSLAADFVAHTRFIVRNRIELRERQGRRYQWTSGLRWYWLDPGSHRRHVNPDGPIGGPVLDVEGGVRFSDDPGGRGLAVGDVAVSIPISLRLTGGLGYRFYQQHEVLDAVSVYGKINLFFGAYSSGSAWDNPDGPPGRLVFRLTAGGSSRGSMAQARILVPLNSSLTLSTYARYKQLEVSDYRAYSAGVGLAWYPSH